MIPKKMHFIWVGDETKRPNNCIETWRVRNPTWEIVIWGNDDLRDRGWINGRHMAQMSESELNGVADMMRWEIVYEQGGFVIDADSICTRSLDDDLLDCEAFTCWENEIARPGLLAAGYFASVPNNPFVGQIILDIHNEETVIDRMAWETVGPQRLTDTYRDNRYHGLRIYPSHYFIPQHFSGILYDGPGRIYAHQLWGSTLELYDHIHLQELSSQEAAQEIDLERQSSAEQSSALEAQHDPYFVQKVEVSGDFLGQNRTDVLRAFCTGKRVIHVGCADWPITSPETSLHLALDAVCKKLDGFDIQEDALDALAPFTKGQLFSRFEDIVDEYDIVLVPEVMEHVANVSEFLAALNKLKASTILISVPDAYQCHKRHFDYLSDTETFVEVVHPDHNCWYTPYTLANTLSKYTDWHLDKVWFFNNISILAKLTK